MTGFNTATAQFTQNPFWVIPSQLPMMVRNGQLPPGQIVSLPFSFPSTPSGPNYQGYPGFNVRFTSSNGIFDECGDYIFYIAHDNVFRPLGIGATNLILKDRWIKWDDPTTPWDNPHPNPNRTENFEAPIVEKPGIQNSGQYYIVYSDCREVNSSNDFCHTHIATYNSNSQGVIQELDPDRRVSWSTSGQVRYAISQEKPNGGRDLFIVGRHEDITKVEIDGNGNILSPVIIKQAFNGWEKQELASEAELSHDGTLLAWAIKEGNSAVVHTFDLTTNTHVPNPIVPGGINRIFGLEFLPNGNLAISASWNPPYNAAPFNFNGICVLDLNTGSLAPVPNTASFINSMLELGAGMPGFLYANNGSQALAIDVNTLTINTAYSVNPLVGQQPLMSYHSDAPGLFFLFGLPDQIDGEFYVSPNTCGGGTPPIQRVATPPTINWIPFSELKSVAPTE
ncbi:MAG: hypothetical protein AAGI38_07500 [Bacteroidota bacterium]